MHKFYSVDEARKKLEHYCSYQDRCHQEVLQKLKSMNMIPQAADVIIAHLIEHNFLNEERFALNFARGKNRIKHWGKQRIVNELKARNISAYIINKAIDEIATDEYLDAFNVLAEKLWHTLKETNPLKKKRKVADNLLRKGFESSLVYEKISLLADK